MQRVITYIDGFNLYFGLKAKFGRKYLWLDLERLSSSLLKPGQKLQVVKYFTSHIQGSPAKIARQDVFLEALETLPLIQQFFGQFLVNDHVCPACGNIEHIPSEKMTDVNIATHMLVDAYENSFDVAILISGDSDLSGPISEIRRLFPSKRIVVAFPPSRASFELKKVANAWLTIGRAKIDQSQFPDIVVKSDGYNLRKPINWT